MNNLKNILITLWIVWGVIILFFLLVSVKIAFAVVCLFAIVLVIYEEKTMKNSFKDKDDNIKN